MITVCPNVEEKQYRNQSISLLVKLLDGSSFYTLRLCKNICEQISSSKRTHKCIFSRIGAVIVSMSLGATIGTNGTIS